MRQEVIEDHLRQQRVQRMRTQQQAVGGAAAGAGVPPGSAPGQDQAGVAPADGEVAGNAVPEISQEFLDALPPELQEEVGFLSKNPCSCFSSTGCFF